MVISEKCYVAFLDILGFKNIVLNYEISEIEEIFKEIADTRTELFRNNRGLLDVIDMTLDDTYIRIMSDSIVIAIPTRIQTSLVFICECCRTIQSNLLQKGVLLRGGISEGDFYGDEEIMFGKGLVNAYNLEGIAEYPRIIISPDVVHAYDALVGTSTPIYITDMIVLAEDDLYYINYLMCIFGKEAHENVKNFIVHHIENGNQSPNVRRKYLWLKDYFNKCTQGANHCEGNFTKEEYIDIDITKGR